jgi:hypothetical protein
LLWRCLVARFADTQPDRETVSPRAIRAATSPDPAVEKAALNALLDALGR